MTSDEQERKLDQLYRTHAITPRDQALMQALSRIKVLDLTQIARLFWPKSLNSRIAYNRLRRLVTEYEVLESFQFASSTVEIPGLNYHLVYRLSPLGRVWLKRQNIPPGYHSKPTQVGHDLLVAEVYVRLQLALKQRQPAWSCRWYGEPDIAYYPAPNADQPVVVPDGLVVLYSSNTVRPRFAFFLEMDASRASHGRPSSGIGRKVYGYQRFYERPRTNEIVGGLPEFPWVTFVVAGERRMPHVAQAILGHRRLGTVNYALAVLEDVVRAHDLLADPIWAKVAADQTEVWGGHPSERTPLLIG